MLDWLEARGFDLDGLDSGQSLRLHSWLCPNADPQSICSRLVQVRAVRTVWTIGKKHCHRSYRRYHPHDHD